jgi:hypothetical protein
VGIRVMCEDEKMEEEKEKRKKKKKKKGKRKKQEICNFSIRFIIFLELGVVFVCHLGKGQVVQASVSPWKISNPKEPRREPTSCRQKQKTN